MKFKNLTPHPLNIMVSDGTWMIMPVDGTAPRLATKCVELGNISGVPFVKSSMGSPEGLPDEENDTILIVSALVAGHPHLQDRKDLAHPGEAIRDSSGKIVGAKGLCAGPGLANILLIEKNLSNKDT